MRDLQLEVRAGKDGRSEGHQKLPSQLLSGLFAEDQGD
jgi:hypothetical protein